jgi:hypothetical protein
LVNASALLTTFDGKFAVLLLTNDPVAVDVDATKK